MTIPIPTPPTPPPWPNGPGISDSDDIGWSFRKSSFCGSGGCVEVARDRDTVLVRDSKDPSAEPLEFDPRGWRLTLSATIAYDFPPGTSTGPDGIVWERAGRVLRYTWAEWDAFAAGVKSNEFDFDTLTPASDRGVGADEVAVVTGQLPAACATGEGDPAIPSPVAPMNGSPIGDEPKDSQPRPTVEIGQVLVDLVKPEFEWGDDLEAWSRDWAWAAYGAGVAAGLASAQADREALVDAANEWAKAAAPLVQHVPATLNDFEDSPVSTPGEAPASSGVGAGVEVAPGAVGVPQSPGATDPHADECTCAGCEKCCLCGAP